MYLSFRFSILFSFFLGCVVNFFIFIFIFCVASTWSMPATLNGPPPYTPRVPASSNCQTYQATDLFVATSTVSSFSFSLSSSSHSDFSFLFFFFGVQSSTAATVTGTKGSGGSGASGGSGTGSGSGSTSTSASSSAVSLMSGVPSTAFCALGLGVLAGIALVF